MAVGHVGQQLFFSCRTFEQPLIVNLLRCLQSTGVDVDLPCLAVFPGKTRKVEGRCMTIELILVSYQEVQR